MKEQRVQESEMDELDEQIERFIDAAVAQQEEEIKMVKDSFKDIDYFDKFWNEFLKGDEEEQ